MSAAVSFPAAWSIARQKLEMSRVISRAESGLAACPDAGSTANETDSRAAIVSDLRMAVRCCVLLQRVKSFLRVGVLGIDRQCGLVFGFRGVSLALVLEDRAETNVRRRARQHRSIGRRIRDP